jgi:YbbR domain-containing protein
VLGTQTELEKINSRDINIELEKISEDSSQPKVSLPDAFSQTLKIKSVKPSVITLK